MPNATPNSTRLAKRLADQVPCSRQEAEQYIAGGWVTVDGEVVEEAGCRVQPEQRIELLPQASLAPVTPVTILMHKPAGVVARSAKFLTHFTCSFAHSVFSFIDSTVFSGTTLMDLKVQPH